ncbi:MAG: AAA family ATPase [Candidatus Omnitrophica bacterium]|nr:AAA family ATPase [Candidatus Omnitrophota bacterium]
MPDDFKNELVRETKTELPTDFEFNDEFRAAFELLENSREHIFITGKAGTGKSTLLEYFRMNTRKNIVVLAPTGVAAIKVHGQTIHSFFRFPPRFILRDHIKRLYKDDLMHRIDAVVIDEASMVRADLLDGIDSSLRLNRNEMNSAFGGARMILFGDLFQLPPVVNKEFEDILKQRYTSPYFFSANVFREIKLRTIDLSKIYRQKDEKFISLLNKVREKICAADDLFGLNERVDSDNREENEGVVTLTATNSVAERINKKRLAQISNEEFTYSASIEGEFKDKDYPVEKDITLKTGAQVIMVKNDPKKQWVNGTICRVVELSDSLIRVSIDQKICDVPKMTWEKIRYSHNKKTDNIEEKVIGCFKQYPIKLAWAITIHKSQGQTFDKVMIDIGRGAFTHGQTYVALSRCRALEGIRLKRPIAESDIIFDNKIYDFMNSINDTNEIQVVDL